MTRFLLHAFAGLVAGAAGMVLAGVGVTAAERHIARQRAAQKRALALHGDFDASAYGRRQR